MKFTDLKLGSPVTNVHIDDYKFDNFIVTGLGHNWAVLMDVDRGTLCPYTRTYRYIYSRLYGREWRNRFIRDN